jgi:hypothetical protein
VGKTGGDTDTRPAVICPSCGEVYDTPERVTDVLRNSGFCVNLTCLHDLTREPFDAVLLKAKEERRADRRVS